jgi:Tol biopolymer transport system component
MRIWIKAGFMLLLLWTFTFRVYAQQTTTDFTKLTGPYLGQKPPGMIPELFAPGIISFGYHEHRIAISPDSNEIYFTVFSTSPNRAIIMYTILLNGVWTIPLVASFSDLGWNLHPAFSRDGKRIFFTSTRPRVNHDEKKNGADIWYVERQGNSWSQPVNLGASINTEHNESSPFVTSDGTLFFESNRNTDKNDLDIYVSYLKKGIYQKAEKLSNPVNTKHEEGGPCISSNGSYLIFYSNRPGTFGEADLYITFKKKDGTWDEPINLGETINSKFYDWAPSITPDGKYIFFSSQRNVETIITEYNSYRVALQKNLGQPKVGFGTFYWVSAKIIEDLKPKE